MCDSGKSGCSILDKLKSKCGILARVGMCDSRLEKTRCAIPVVVEPRRRGAFPIPSGYCRWPMAGGGPGGDSDAAHEISSSLAVICRGLELVLISSNRSFSPYHLAHLSPGYFTESSKAQMPILDLSLALILLGHVGSGPGSLSLSLSLSLCFISCGPMVPIRVGIQQSFVFSRPISVRVHKIFQGTSPKPQNTNNNLRFEDHPLLFISEFSTAEVQPSSDASHDLHGDPQSIPVVEAPKADSGSASNANNYSRKVSREDIELVQNLIERCLQLYMTRSEVVRTLSNRARIEPGFTTLVWQKLEEENADFFRAYYIRLKLKKQIILFNHLLEHQYHLMKYPVQPKVPLAPIQNGIHTMPGQPHIDSMACGLSSCHVVNGIPAPGGFHPIRINSATNETPVTGRVYFKLIRTRNIHPLPFHYSLFDENFFCFGIMIGSGTPEVAHATPPCGTISSMSEMALSPASAASSNHFPFTPEMSGIGMDATALESTFPSDATHTGGLQLGSDDGHPRDGTRSLGQLWNFSLSDLTADFSNLGDLGILGDYDGSPFLPSDSDILLGSPEQDDIVEEYFADVANGSCSHQSDEEKP
ncbi:hypothetical protein ZIOFF_043872 [Zingiber officinale]|uniref:Uncharacterized protein n=1 Tax=Zingiber officinale TaxID=94328 RepID=A0A8J5G4Z3_ZINOF|nr:hypothetical protein ZIOFF_043872 [Zingiber officinale]